MSVKQEKGLTFLYFAVYLIAALTIALHQPHTDTPPLFGNPPDEHSRYKVPLYIEEHGELPTGFEEELFSEDCRWTYGFYTLLPYMIQGAAMKVVSLFTDSALTLLYTARMVNVISGLWMAYLVLLIGKKVFHDDRVRWIFCFLVTFLPQSLFMHTYVNPDSLCMLSTALMIYGLLRGYEDAFSVKSCVIFTLGMILCTLSYYNAYGYLVSSFLLFTAYYIKRKDGRWSFDYKPFLKKGCLIAASVIVLTGWSFVRNYLLYDGDFIGLSTKEAFIRSFGIARETYQSQGYSLLYMLTHTSFLPKVMISFIANFGSGTIYTYPLLYVLYLLFFAMSVVGLFCRMGNSGKVSLKTKFFHINMIFCILMPFILLLKYAYSVDYQAQGRYLMPAVIPIMYYVCMGFERLPVYRKGSERRKTVLTAGVLVFLMVALLIMVFCNALPIYLMTPVL
ncbi:MAG: DUF2142 domain-containing protein [Lachnospiraceae bacterium]